MQDLNFRPVGVKNSLGSWLMVDGRLVKIKCVVSDQVLTKIKIPPNTEIYDLITYNDKFRNAFIEFVVRKNVLGMKDFAQLDQQNPEMILLQDTILLYENFSDNEIRSELRNDYSNGAINLLLAYGHTEPFNHEIHIADDKIREYSNNKD